MSYNIGVLISGDGSNLNAIINNGINVKFVVSNNQKARGLLIAKKNNIPDRIIDFIRTHHGTTTVEYFYKQYITNFPDEEVWLMSRPHNLEFSHPFIRRALHWDDVFQHPREVDQKT